MLFPHLFTPHGIRGVEIRNRIISTAHQTILVRNGRPTDELAAYHEARAAGGAGLIIIESARPPVRTVTRSPRPPISTPAGMSAFPVIEKLRMPFTVMAAGCSARLAMAAESPTDTGVC